ncbi:YceI family protein [Pseudomonas sp. O230]|uniref:YceI family protein n=1 Tax=Pseudomonas sp. O230 TaxID=3159450 RepID=UPI00387AABF9
MTLRFTRSAAVFVALSFGVLSCADAVEYKQVNASASTLSFTYNQFSSQVYGTFGKFEGTLDFDTANPSAARAGLTIQLDSIDAGNSDANEELKKPAWFDTATYPQGTFESTRVNALGNNRYSITGNLTLKTITRAVEVPVLLKSESGIGIFDGQLTLKRSDFKIGAGEWADTVVSDDINIRFRMVAPQQ